MSVGIGATNDGCNRDNRSIIVETVFRYKTIKAAAFTHMRKLDPRYVVGDGPCLCGDTTNLIWWHEKKLGLLSMNLAMSQGQAIRSITGRSRVTHFITCLLKLRR